MSVLIKGLKMPKECRECKMLTYYSTSGCSMCDIAEKALARNFKPIPFDGRPDWCPLVEIPEPHGTLIDRDALNIGEYEREDDDTGTLEISLGGLLEVYHRVKDAPAIIARKDGENHDD